MAAIDRPALTVTPRTQEWWDAAAEGRLLLQRCGAGHVQHYPRVICARCWSEDLAWVEASGVGRVWSFTIVHKPGHPGWASDAPYAIALVELDEGPRLMSNIVGIDPARVRVGMPVRAVAVEQPGDPRALLRFEPLGE